MPRGKRSSSGTDDRVQGLAMRFAGEIQRIVRDGIADEVRAQLARVLDGIARSGSGVRVSVGASAGDRRIGKAPVPVQCPAPGCRSVGIRAKRNFCPEHAESLSEAEKARLREQQLARRGAQRVPAAAKKARRPGRKKPGEATP